MGRQITVLMSFPRPRSVANPFNSLLMTALADQPGTQVLTFSWRRALLGRFDVFHVHWPENLVSGHSKLKTLGKQALFCIFMIRLLITRRPMVRTMHNLELPRGISRVQTVLLRWAERATTYWIVLNDSTPISADRPHAVVLHGHYRDWYARFPASDTTLGLIGFFGRIRRYKNAVGLVRAFTQLPDPGLALRVAGLPSSKELETELMEVAGEDGRIRLEFEFLDDPALVRHVTSSELVVLPYPEMHNSGSAFAALSMHRPVLLPDNEVNARLADEVGSDWVIRYPGDLKPEHIKSALDQVRSIKPGAAPDLSQREWPRIAAQHVAVYEAAIAARRPRVKADHGDAAS